MSAIKDVIAKVKQTDPNQPEFHQAVEEVMETLEPTVKKHPEYVKANIYERIVEPERAMQFRLGEGNLKEGALLRNPTLLSKQCENSHLLITFNSN